MYPELYEAICDTIDRQYFDPAFTGVDWPAVRERYAAAVRDVNSDEAFHAVGLAMLAELPASHLDLLPPTGARRVRIGARVHRIEGKEVVTTVFAGTDAQRRGLRVGDQLLTPADELPGLPGSSVTLRVRGCDDVERSMQIRREDVPLPQRRPALHWHLVQTAAEHRIGVLTVNHFDRLDRREIDAAMADLLKADSLIVDLRDTPGGDISCIYLASYLVNGRELVAGMLTREYMAKLESPEAGVDLAQLPAVGATDSLEQAFKQLGENGGVSLWTADVEARFEGRLIVLANEGTRSAAEGFLAYFQQRTDTPIVGRATAGHLLNSALFDLPDGWQLRVPTAVLLTADGEIFKDTPVPPTDEVAWTYEDVCLGRDPDMTRALELLEEAPSAPENA